MIRLRTTPVSFRPTRLLRFLAFACLLLGLSSATAKGFSVGASVDAGFFPLSLQSPELQDVPTTPTSLGVQVTAHRLLDIIGLRGTVDVGLKTGAVDVGGDVLLSFNLFNLRPYIGLGVGTTLSEASQLNTHGVVGLELLLLSSFGLYAELDPTLHFDNATTFETKLRAGANFHF